MKRRLWMLAGLLLLPRLALGGSLPVIDTAAIAQFVRQLEAQAKDYAEQIRQYENQIRQIYNQYDQIKYAYETVKHGAQNLQRLDLNYETSLSGVLDQLQGKLNQARQIGYTVSGVVGQAQRLYPAITETLTPEGLRAHQQRWTTVRREAAQVALQVQAIKQDQAATMRRATELLNKSTQAQGNLDIQQAQVQGQGLLLTQLVAIETQLATQGHLKAIADLEVSAMTEATSRALDEAGATVDLSAPARGRLLPLSK